MINPIDSLQQYISDLQAEIISLKESLSVKPNVPPSAPARSESAILEGHQVMHFSGEGEPFTLTARQLEIVRACWSEVQGFLWEHGSRERTEQAEKATPSAQPAVRVRTTSTESKGWAASRAAELGVSLSPAGSDSAFRAPSDGTEEEVPGAQEARLPLRERPNYGISRIDQPEKANHGWYVRMTRKGRTEQRFFADKSNGGRDNALQKAREFRDTLIQRIDGKQGRPPAAASGSYFNASGNRSMLEEEEDDLRI